ncbi:MAG: hypothetical protein P4L40_11425 [Terracidiphilus sp.]|nr:hypothetical protein [Terracidiphilus sp.]
MCVCVCVCVCANARALCVRVCVDAVQLGETALMLACAAGNVPAIQFLVCHGAALEARSGTEHTVCVCVAELFVE